jgi:hypothetical protein
VLRGGGFEHVPDPLADVAAGSVAATHDNVRFALLERIQHLGQELLIVLSIGIDDRKIRRRGHEHTFDTGGRQTASPDSLNTLYATIVRRECSYPVCRTIRRIVIDEYDFPGTTFKALSESVG